MIFNIRNLFVLFITTFLLAACDEDFFSKTIDVDSDWQGPEVVVQSRMNTADDTLSLLLHYSKPVFEVVKEGIHHIPGAEVKLLGDDGSQYQFEFDTTFSESANYFAIADAPLNPGVTYELVIEHPDFERVSSIQKMPLDLVPIGFEWTKNYRRDFEDSISYTLLELSYQGRDNELFSSHIIRFSAELNGEPLTFPTDFSSTRFEFGSYDFQEELFDNLSVSNRNSPKAIYEIDDELLDLSEFDNPILRIYASSITQDDYLFYETVSAQTVTANLPFVEPVIVYGNMENALGIFSLINTTEYSIPLPQ